MNGINTDDVAHPLVRYRNHLEFHGYHVEEEDDDSLYCRHPRNRKKSLFVYNYSLGVSITIFYFFKTEVMRTDLLEYVNELNSEFMYMKGYIDWEDTLILQIFFNGDYDRRKFSILLDNIEDDISVLDKNKLTKEYLEYLE